MTAQPDLFDVGQRDETQRPKIPCTAGPIGSGPAGETCRTCDHLVRVQMSKTYLKCGLMKKFWTHGAGSDIKARWAACEKWQAIKKETAKP